MREDGDPVKNPHDSINLTYTKFIASKACSDIFSEIPKLGLKQIHLIGVLQINA